MIKKIIFGLLCSLLILSFMIGNAMNNNKKVEIKKNELIEKYALTTEELNLINQKYNSKSMGSLFFLDVEDKIKFYKSNRILTFDNVTLKLKDMKEIKSNLNITDEIISKFEKLHDIFREELNEEYEKKKKKEEKEEERLYGHIPIAKDEESATKKLETELFNDIKKFGVFRVKCDTALYTVNIEIWSNVKTPLTIGNVAYIRNKATDLAQEHGIIRNKTIKVKVNEAVKVGDKEGIGWENNLGEYSFKLGVGWDKDVK